MCDFGQLGHRRSRCSMLFWGHQFHAVSVSAQKYSVVLWLHCFFFSRLAETVWEMLALATSWQIPTSTGRLSSQLLGHTLLQKHTLSATGIAAFRGNANQAMDIGIKQAVVLSINIPRECTLRPAILRISCKIKSRNWFFKTTPTLPFCTYLAP